MYNLITEEKIKDIPQIGDINLERLPQELTRIYAQIISLRQQVVEGAINFKDDTLLDGLHLLRELANNLETILLTFPKHERKQSIAFVAATANNLIYKMGLIAEEEEILLSSANISPYVTAVVLFLIGNSQADAAEMAISLNNSVFSNVTEKELIICLSCLASGHFADLNDIILDEKLIIKNANYEEIAIEYLWRELGLGIKMIAGKLSGKIDRETDNNHFKKVIDLCISEQTLFDQNNIITGPFRLAKLLVILEGDILQKAVIDIPSPTGVDTILWKSFLEKLAEERPYLWENHKEAIETNFLNLGTSAVLTFPTGAGKSTLSELKIASCLYSHKNIIYLVPTHALEDQIQRNLKKLFGNYEPTINFEFGGEYSDFEDLSSSPILVMTPERCLTVLNISPEYFNTVGLVVFDEFHLIHGTDIKKDRRAIDAMYCLLSLFTLIPKADFLLISAMVENGNDICDWLSKITNRETILFNSTWKPTRQLHGCLVFEQSDVTLLEKDIQTQKSTEETIRPPKRLKQRLDIFPYCFFSLKNIWETEKDEDYYRAEILNENIFLDVNDNWNLTSNRNAIAARLGIHFGRLGIKTLIFVDDPRVVKSTAERISLELNDRPNNYDSFLKENNYYINCLAMELGDLKYSFLNLSENVGTHHGLLLPIERTLTEKYFKHPEGSIVLVATATLAQGINLPAEIVIIAGDDRFDEESGFREGVKPHELLNAAGRAGRAGQSSQGAVILIPGDIVTIEDTTISKRWWELKNRVFSKGDQCLKIEDPLEHFLDSLQIESDQLDIFQISTLYRFKSRKLSDTDTQKLLRNSLYAFYESKADRTESFEGQVKNLLDKRDKLDDLTEDINWVKEISFKTGLDPFVIIELGDAIDKEDIEYMLSFSITKLITWFFQWLKISPDCYEKIFTKQSTTSQIKRALGLRQDQSYEIPEILSKIDIIMELTIHYISGMTLFDINQHIPNTPRPDKSLYLIKARNFVNRLVPELSFCFGLLSLVVIEKAKQKGELIDMLPNDLRYVASCIREGFDTSNKLFFKKENHLTMRVETHKKYNL
jgi:ATP-dependent RNA helicase DOB1